MFIPLRDENPTSRWPVVTVLLIAVNPNNGISGRMHGSRGITEVRKAEISGKKSQEMMPPSPKKLNFIQRKKLEEELEKIRQEEQVLDMETYYKNKQEGEKEAKKLAKLAKFKHDQAQDAESTLSSSQFESVQNDDEFWQEEEEEDKAQTVRREEDQEEEEPVQP